MALKQKEAQVAAPASAFLETVDLETVESCVDRATGHQGLSKGCHIAPQQIGDAYKGHWSLSLSNERRHEFELHDET